MGASMGAGVCRHHAEPLYDTNMSRVSLVADTYVPGKGKRGLSTVQSPVSVTPRSSVAFVEAKQGMFTGCRGVKELAPDIFELYEMGTAE